jgi:hypothetical protein
MNLPEIPAIPSFSLNCDRGMCEMCSNPLFVRASTNARDMNSRTLLIIRLLPTIGDCFVR